MIDDGKRVAAGGARLQWHLIPIADIDLIARNSAEEENGLRLKLRNSSRARHLTFHSRLAGLAPFEIDSCAPAHLKLVRVPALSPLPLAALPSMSVFPNAPFDLSVLPSYVAGVPAAPFAHCFPRNFTFYVALPIRSIARAREAGEDRVHGT